MADIQTNPNLDLQKLPKHVAVIMDGNRRWAKSRGMGSTEGHRQAALNTIEPIIERCGELGIKYVTFWAFSTENWKRDEEELKGLFDVFRLGLASLAARFIQKGANLRILGDINRFPADIAKKTLEMMSQSKKNDKIFVTFALNYGGRDEILRAVKKIVNEKLLSDSITDEVFSLHLDTAGIPDPDLIIRTGGEQRLSGYLPWQSVYAELYFVSTLFPDFSPVEFEKALFWYQQRDRRLGK
ncbi:di-trans,poly-cis-decaprenylcistransferase [Candidatus Shapirobacteria bacterium]|nr:di-trans,poly-cis-decaprenylcistransferase [Candidatus Shapirobacteria bacterium]